MFTNKEANDLIETQKHLENPDRRIDISPNKQRINLFARSYTEYKFFIEINPSTKMRFKMTLHCQEENTNIALLRIDYKGTHVKNPEQVKDTVPEFLKPYAGREFKRESHIHFYVEGYKPLAWAMPLSKYNFEIKNLENDNDYTDALFHFGRFLNVVPDLNIQYTLSWVIL